jgi:hypothetical protein
VTDDLDAEDVTVLYSTPAHTLEVADQVIIEGDLVEVRNILETEDVDEVVVLGYSYTTGDVERFELFADDEYEIWSV